MTARSSICSTRRATRISREDTYRTLTAVDSAVMVIDAAKGIEAQTRKLFEVCRLRDMPIMTFINKMDREARDPFELLDEISDQLQLDVAPMAWPAGMGLNFKGVYDLYARRIPCRFGDGAERRRMPDDVRAKLDDDVELAARRTVALRRGLLSRGPSVAGLFRLGAEEFRRARTADGPGRACAAAAPASRPGPRRSNRRTAKSPASSSRSRPTWTPTIATAWRSCRLALGPVPPQHEAEPVGHRQDDRRAQSDPVLRRRARDGGRGLAGRHHRHSQPRRAARRRHAVGIGHRRLHRHPQFRAGDSAPRAAGRSDEAETSGARARPASPKKA